MVPDVPGICHVGGFSGLFGLLDRLVERRADQVGRGAPQGRATDLLSRGSGERLGARIGIDNGLRVIDDKYGIRKRLKHVQERLTRLKSDTPGLLGIGHTVVPISFTYPILENKDAFLLEPKAHLVK